MAEIRVEHRPGGIWRWIVALVLLGLVVWGLAEWLGEDAAEVERTPGAVSMAAQPEPARRTRPSASRAPALLLLPREQGEHLLAGG